MTTIIFIKNFANKILQHIFAIRIAKELAKDVHLSSNYMVVINGGHRKI